MTFSIMTFSIMTFNNVTTFNQRILSITIKKPHTLLTLLTVSIKTIRKMTFSIAIFITTPFRIPTFSIMALSIIKNATLSILSVRTMVIDIVMLNVFSVIYAKCHL
jgi:hypothetical protein